jgi:glutamyl-tRNA reductase
VSVLAVGLSHNSAPVPVLERAAVSDRFHAGVAAISELLHSPTVRVKELAGSAGGQEYAAALRIPFGPAQSSADRAMTTDVSGK